MFHRTLITTFAAASLVVVLAGCEDPAKGKPKATVGSAEAASSAAPGGSHAAAAPSGAPIKFDNTTGSIGFVGSKVTGKHEGKFEKFEGSFTLADGKPEGGKVDVTIDLASAKTDQEGLDKHLKTPDFFDVEKTPKATFASTEIKAGGAGGATHTVTGTLEIRGQKKSVTFPMTITVGDADVTGKAEFSINRKDWGIAIAGKPDDLIRDDVVVKLDLKAPKKK